MCLLLLLVHQGLGLAFHVWFCRVHGFTWYAVEDPERYVQLSKEMVGYVQPETSSAPTSVYGVELPANRASQCQGEPAGIEWSVDAEEEEEQAQGSKSTT